MKPSLLAINAPRSRRALNAGPRVHTVSLHIERLSLQGFTQVNRRNLRDALLQRLDTLVTEAAATPGAFASDARRSTTTATHHLQSDSDAAQIGDAISNALKKSLGSSLRANAARSNALHGKGR